MKKIIKNKKTLLWISGGLLCLMMLTFTLIYTQLIHPVLTTEPVTGDVYEFNADAITVEQDGDSYILTNNFVGDDNSVLMYAWYVHKDGASEPFYRRAYSFGNRFRFTPDYDGGAHAYDIKAWVLSNDGRWKNAYCSKSITVGLDNVSPERKPIYLIFTVDTEDCRGGVPNLIEGDLGEKGVYGVDYIMDRFERHNMDAVFFVNVYEAPNYTDEWEGYMDSLLKRIDSRGHEVALHAHENTLLDGMFDYMLANYDADQQTEILTYGCDMIENATGRRPISFRSGSYSANDDTFEALRRCGLKYDSSSFYFHYNNLFTGYTSINQVCDMDGVYEFPVISLYDRGGQENKLDIDRLSWEEILAVIHEMQLQDDFPVVQIMFHSFTFLEQNAYGQEKCIFEDGNKTVYDYDAPDCYNFDMLLDAVQKDDTISVVTFRDLEEMGFTAPSIESDSMFCVPTDSGTAAAESFDLASAVE